MIVAFEDAATGTSNVKVIRQNSALDLEELQDAYHLCWEGALFCRAGWGIGTERTMNKSSMMLFLFRTRRALDGLMRKGPLYYVWAAHFHRRLLQHGNLHRRLQPLVHQRSRLVPA